MFTALFYFLCVTTLCYLLPYVFLSADSKMSEENCQKPEEEFVTYVALQEIKTKTSSNLII